MYRGRNRERHKWWLVWLILDMLHISLEPSYTDQRYKWDSDANFELTSCVTFRSGWLVSRADQVVRTLKRPDRVAERT